MRLAENGDFVDEKSNGGVPAGKVVLRINSGETHDIVILR